MLIRKPGLCTRERLYPCAFTGSLFLWAQCSEPPGDGSSHPAPQGPSYTPIPSSGCRCFYFGPPKCAWWAQGQALGVTRQGEGSCVWRGSHRPLSPDPVCGQRWTNWEAGSWARGCEKAGGKSGFSEGPQAEGLRVQRLDTANALGVQDPAEKPDNGGQPLSVMGEAGGLQGKGAPRGPGSDSLAVSWAHWRTFRPARPRSAPGPEPLGSCPEQGRLTRPVRGTGQ